MFGENFSHEKRLYGFRVICSVVRVLRVIQVAQTVPEAIEVYGTDCVRSGNIEGTEAYADCISQTWILAEEKERVNQQKKEMLLMIRGSGMQNTRSSYNNPFNPLR